MAAAFGKQSQIMRAYFLQRIVQFFVALFLGAAVPFAVGRQAEKQNAQDDNNQTHQTESAVADFSPAVNRNGSGIAASCHGRISEQQPKQNENCKNAVDVSLQIIKKPKAEFTDEARNARFSGTIRLRVTFSASGHITSATVINKLPFGLSEQAIAAAKRIEFKPAMRCGVPVSISKPIAYTFSFR